MDYSKEKLTNDQQIVMDKLYEGKKESIIVATSQYASNTTAVGFVFDAHCSSPALKGLAKRGLITLESSWRYATVTRV